MAQSKYYIGSMGNLFYRSGEPVHISPPKIAKPKKPVLVLRPRPTVNDEDEEALRVPQGAAAPSLSEDGGGESEELSDASDHAISTKADSHHSEDAVEAAWRSSARKLPDGPWIRHPDEIDEGNDMATERIPDDMTIKEYRDRHKQRHADMMKMPKSNRMDGFLRMLCVVTSTPAIDMAKFEGGDEERLELEVERWYVNTATYLYPHADVPPDMNRRSGCDWRWNARGVYYRHYCSPEWVTGDHSLWIPTHDGLDWNGPAEEARRARGRTFLKHALDNERWTKSEYGWEADAWTDLFGQMRDDPAVAADKHEYYAMRESASAVSCLLKGKSDFVMRIPDATFGLATFKPKHYQNAIASYDLDAERLQALALQRNCSLLGDPRWGEANLVFPFAVYEAKGWKGDPREARYQACAAAAVYLDLLDALARQPSPSGKADGAYQTPESRSTQVFALTSFGAHWHIMVGYRRPRLSREHAGCPGMSDMIYLFQRIWSGRVTTERKAWELLSLVDQIHEWGVTTHRDFVIRHLKPWHAFSERCYRHDARVMHARLRDGRDYDGQTVLRVDLPAAWAQHLKPDTRAKLEQARRVLTMEAYRRYFRAKPPVPSGDSHQPGEIILPCVIGECGPAPGYPIASDEEAIQHLKDCHGEDYYASTSILSDNEEVRRVISKTFADELDKADGRLLDKLDQGVEDQGSEAEAEAEVPLRVGEELLGGRKRVWQEAAVYGDPGPSSKRRA